MRQSAMGASTSTALHNYITYIPIQMTLEAFLGHSGECRLNSSLTNKNYIFVKIPISELYFPKCAPYFNDAIGKKLTSMKVGSQLRGMSRHNLLQETV